MSMYTQYKAKFTNYQNRLPSKVYRPNYKGYIILQYYKSGDVIISLTDLHHIQDSVIFIDISRQKHELLAFVNLHKHRILKYHANLIQN